MNIHVNFLDGYVDSGARVADLDRIVWDVDYIYNADHRSRVDAFVCVTDDPTIGELMAMYEASSYADEPGYRTSWMTY